jgi:hypothetical protein
MGRRLGLVVAAALAAGAAAAATERTFRITLPEGTARVVVPRRFEPLLPGSIYPDKNRRVKARHLPVAAVDRRLAARGRGFLLERGFLVVETPPGGVAIASLQAALSGRPEADASRIVVWGEGSVADTAGAAALALFSPDARASSGVPTAVFRARGANTGTGDPESPPRNLGDSIVEKWYGSAGPLPEQAYRDAAEWLAEKVK